MKGLDFSDRATCDLPDSWEVVAFDEGVEVVSDQGKRLNQSAYQSHGRWKVIDQGESFVGGYTDDEDLVYQGPLPVIVFGDHTRRVKFVESEFVIGAQGVKLLRPRDCFNPKFFAYLLPSLDLPDRGYSRHFQFVRNLRFPVPPLAEQGRIVAAIEEHLTRLDAGVGALERVRANLKRYRASVLRAACEGRLVPTEADQARREGRDYEPADVLLERILKERRARWEAEELEKLEAKGKTPTDDRWKRKYTEPEAPDTSGLPALPEGWVWASMDQLTRHVTSGSRDWKPYYGRGSGTFIMAQNVRMGRFDLSFRQAVDPPVGDSSRERSQVAAGDLLVTIVGANTGEVCRVPAEYPEHYVCQSVALMRPVVNEASPFLELFLISPENGKRQFDNFIYGAGRPHLSFEQLRATVVALPPLQEQRRILAEVERRISTVLTVEADVDNSIARAARLRQSTLKRAFQGRLVPQDPSDEPASALLERIRANRTGAKALALAKGYR